MSAPTPPPEPTPPPAPAAAQADRAARRPLWRRVPWTELIGPGLITAVVLYLFWDLLTGFPVSHDHPAHMFNAWLTSDVLIPSGRLSGWTDLWFAGYPANELYGPGGNLWVTLFRYLTFGQLSYGQTYGIAILALLWLLPISAYVMGRAFVGRTAGIVAGLLMATTGGTWYDLGWFWILEMGVWPFALGAALAFVALVVLRRYLRRGGPRGLALAAAGFALAVLGHPMSLLLLGIAGPVLVAHVLIEQGRGGATRVLMRAMGAAGLGVLLSAVWLVPFVSKSAYSQKLGETWMELHEVVPSLTQLNLYGPEWRLTMGLAAVGIILAIARRQVWVLYLASTGALMLVFASATTQYNLRLFDALSPLASIQFPRFVGVVRVFVYVIAGYTVSELARILVPAVRTRWRAGGNLRTVVLVAPLLMLSVPLLWNLPQYIEENHTPRKETIRTQKELPYYADYQAAAKWIRENVGSKPWSRVAAFGPPYEHVLSALPIDTGLPVYTGGFVPAHTYRFFFEGQRDPEVLHQLGVRYVLTMDGWARGRNDVQHRATFGALRIYELDDARTERVSATDCRSATVFGTDELLGASVWSVPEDGCELRIHRSDFPNWRATFRGTDGTERELEIRRTPVRRKGTYAAFMNVHVPADGSVVLSWEPTRADRAGAWLSIFGVLIFMALLVLTVRRSWWEALKGLLPRPPERVRRGAAIVVWAGIVALVPVVIGVGISRAGERRYTLDRHLTPAEKFVDAGNRRVDCEEAESGRGWTCSERWDEVRGGLFSFVYDNRYCIYAHPSPRGAKHLVFKDVPLGRRLSGFYGLLDSSQGSSPVRMSVRVGKGPPLEFSADRVGQAVGFEIITEPGTADLDFEIQADRPAWRHFCFNAQVIEGDPSLEARDGADDDELSATSERRSSP